MGIYVGVDQALRKIGLCVLCDNDVLLCVTLHPPKDAKGTARLVALRDALHDALTPYSDLAGAALEAQSYGSVGQLDQLGQINGVVQVALADLGVIPLCVPPAVLKKFVTGNGQADKKMMAQASRELWGLSFLNDDECDAHGLARLASTFLRKKATRRCEYEALQSLAPKTRRPSVRKHPIADF